MTRESFRATGGAGKAAESGRWRNVTGTTGVSRIRQLRHIEEHSLHTGADRQVLAHGANCVLGYRQHFDLEGSQLVCRG